MKKKISVISLILLFFVSTTGLPLAVNFCTMMDVPENEMCEMHSEHKTCEYEIHKLSVSTQINKDDCCKTEIIDKSICDKYLQVNVQKLIQNQNKIEVIHDDLSVYNSLIVNPVKYFNDTSPPILLNNHIYLNNSALLI
jgi:hypothetical protein